MSERGDLIPSRTGRMTSRAKAPPVQGENYAKSGPIGQPVSSPVPPYRLKGERQRMLATAATGAIMSAVLILGVYFGVTASQPHAVPAAAPAPAPIAPPPPVNPTGLAAALQVDPGLAGPDGAQLETAMEHVVTTNGEIRRQASVAVLQLAGTGGLTRDYARAATAAVTPFTKLGTPTDMIQDLDPDPAAAGPNAHYVDNCMHDLAQDTTPAEQNAEAAEITEKLPGWSANGGIRPDITAATQQIATTVLQGQQPTDDDDGGATGTSGPTPRPGS